MTYDDTKYVQITGTCGATNGEDAFVGFIDLDLVRSVLFAPKDGPDDGPSKISSPLVLRVRGQRGRDWRIEQRGGGSASLLLRRDRRCLVAFGGLPDLDGTVAVLVYLRPTWQVEKDAIGFAPTDAIAAIARDAPHLVVARRLAEDPTSPWHGRVRMNRNATSGLMKPVNIRMMETVLRELRDIGTSDTLFDLVVAYWRCLARLFPDEWVDLRHHVLGKGVGLYALTLLLADFIREASPDQIGERYFEVRLHKLVGKVDWGNHGTFGEIRGIGGIEEAHRLLKDLTTSLRVLLVEVFPGRRRPNVANGEEGRWYPPVGLMKLSTFHKERGDTVRFVSGCERRIAQQKWDRIYIAATFTFHYEALLRAIEFYLEAVGGDVGRIFAGGVAASVLSDEIGKATGVVPVVGLLGASSAIDIDGGDGVDHLPPDHNLLDPELYAVGNTFYTYATRGCPNGCAWCAVRAVEPEFVGYVDIKPVIRELRRRHGDKPVLKLMDNNVLASPALERIVEDILELGYGRGGFTDTVPPRTRIVDFNQGVDARLLDERAIRLLAKINIQPLRIAFDRFTERKSYVRAVRLAATHGFTSISNYMLYNHRDTPRDLYERIKVNIELNEQFADNGEPRARIFSYPMRYAPVESGANQTREPACDVSVGTRDWLRNPAWTPRFARNVAVMSGVAAGAISPTPTLARRVVGHTFGEFVMNLYAPEVLLRHRNRHERFIHPGEPPRTPGDGKLEAFRGFMMELLEQQDDRFRLFHGAVTPNSVVVVREAIARCKDREMRRWLSLYDRIPQ